MSVTTRHTVVVDASLSQCSHHRHRGNGQPTSNLTTLIDIVFVRNKYWSTTKILTSNNSSCLWFRINKNVIGFDKDLLCGALFIPPMDHVFTLKSLIDIFLHKKRTISVLLLTLKKRSILCGDLGYGSN